MHLGCAEMFLKGLLYIYSVCRRVPDFSVYFLSESLTSALQSVRGCLQEVTLLNLHSLLEMSEESLEISTFPLVSLYSRYRSCTICGSSAFSHVFSRVCERNLVLFKKPTFQQNKHKRVFLKF